MKGTPYNIEQNAVQSEHFPSFLDIVEISNPVIFNMLVDQVCDR